MADAILLRCELPGTSMVTAGPRVYTVREGYCLVDAEERTPPGESLRDAREICRLQSRSAFGQPFYIFRPASADEAASWLEAQSAPPPADPATDPETGVDGKKSSFDTSP